MKEQKSHFTCPACGVRHTLPEYSAKNPNIPLEYKCEGSDGCGRTLLLQRGGARLKRAGGAVTFNGAHVNIGTIGGRLPAGGAAALVMLATLAIAPPPRHTGDAWDLFGLGKRCENDTDGSGACIKCKDVKGGCAAFMAGNFTPQLFPTE